MHYLIFYTDYSLNDLIKNVKEIFNVTKNINQESFIKNDDHIYLFNDQDIIQDIIVNSKNIKESDIITKYKTIQILHFETDYIDYINIINNTYKYILKNISNIYYIPFNIQSNINDHFNDNDFIFLKLDLLKFSKNYPNNLDNLDNIIKNFNIIYNFDRKNINDEEIDVICIWSNVDSLESFQDYDGSITSALEKYCKSKNINLNITDKNYCFAPANGGGFNYDDDCMLLYDLNIKDYSIFKSTEIIRYLEDNCDIYTGGGCVYHLVIKRKLLNNSYMYTMFNTIWYSGNRYMYEEISSKYYQDNYIVSDYDINNWKYYGHDSVSDAILMIDNEYKDDIISFDLI